VRVVVGDQKVFWLGVCFLVVLFVRGSRCLVVLVTLRCELVSLVGWTFELCLCRCRHVGYGRA
jgi:hypothetical protein